MRYFVFFCGTAPTASDGPAEACRLRLALPAPAPTVFFSRVCVLAGFCPASVCLLGMAFRGDGIGKGALGARSGCSSRWLLWRTLTRQAAFRCECSETLPGRPPARRRRLVLNLRYAAAMPPHPPFTG